MSLVKDGEAAILNPHCKMTLASDIKLAVAALSLLTACGLESNGNLPSADATRDDSVTECGAACIAACTANTLCLNGGTCRVNDAERAICTCPKGYAGERCADADPCQPNPCLNGGLCTIAGDVTASCQCPPNLAGDRCDKPAGSCSTDTCLNGGVCKEDSDPPTCECQRGYLPPHCSQPVDCGALRAPDNAMVTTPSTTYDSIASSWCTPGYARQSGDTTRRCTADATWTGSPLVCVASNMDHCASAVCGMGTCVNEADGYQCACEAGWTGTHCSERLLCPALEPPPHGSVSDQTNAGESATYTCSAGYELSGNINRLCTHEGQWSGAQPVCDPLCPSLASPTDGSVQVTGLRPGSKATYTCNAGFGIEGSPEAVCRNTGDWSAVSPTCDPVCATGMKHATVTYTLAMSSGPAPSADSPPSGTNLIWTHGERRLPGTAAYVGPGTATLEYDLQDGKPKGPVFLVGLELDLNFVVTDSNTRMEFVLHLALPKASSKHPAAKGQLRTQPEPHIGWDTFRGAKPGGKNSSVRDFAITGQVHCDGPNCGNGSLPKTGLHDVDEERLDVAFGNFMFSEDDSVWDMAPASLGELFGIELNLQLHAEEQERGCEE